MKVKPIEEIRAVVQPVADSMGLEIVDVEWKMSKNPSLTFYVDFPSGGVDLDTLEKFHNAIDTPLDEFDPYPLPYTLNVSSPGLDRPLKTAKDFEKHLGGDVEIKLFAPMKGVKFMECKLVGYDEYNVEVEFKGATFKIPLNKIVKINQAIKFE